MHDENCIFCKIANKEIPAEIVYESEKFTAFLDVNPIKQGHVLVVPKNHEEYIFDLNDEEYTELMLETKNIARILKNKLNPKKVGMVIEGFGVQHIHIHLIPIDKGNELNPENARPANPEELMKIAEKIRKTT